MPNILFRNEDHCYFDCETGEVYTSVTTFIKKFEVEKNWREIATKYAKKNGHDVDYWLAKWKNTSTEAAQAGTNYHSMREDQFESMAAEGQAVYINKLVDGIKHSKPLSTLEEGIHSELILYNEEFKIAGQSDVVKIEGKKFKINDFKTSKSIDSTSFYNYKTGYEYMIGPLSHLQNCNLNKFALQTSLYAYFLELEGWECDGLTIEHTKDNNKLYDLHYLKDEVIAMLNYNPNEHEFDISKFA